ncbi:MAG: 30S ribosomal protein S6 [Rickettsiaceae bacterium]|nr:30S ribosomal protein S6 [Rickettsiaceae bacterium]
MALYETILIIRQDVSSADVDKLTEEFIGLLTKFQSKILKTEYWGLRNLAYDISNNKKGHYLLIATDSSAEALRELERKLKFSEDVIRHMTIKVESVSDEPSAILQNKSDGFDDIIDVTII